MKMRPEHFTHILTTFKAHKDDIPRLREFIIREGRAKDVETRVRWEMLYAWIDSRWICDEVYTYLDDDHIDTALRAVLKQLYTSRT